MMRGNVHKRMMAAEAMMEPPMEKPVKMCRFSKRYSTMLDVPHPKSRPISFRYPEYHTSGGLEPPKVSRRSSLDSWV